MPEERSRIWIDGFQSRLYFRVVAYWLIAVVSVWNFLFVWRLVEEGKGDPLEQFTRYCVELYPVLICFAVLVPFFAWDAVRFAHRLVGPLVRIRKAVRALAESEPTRPIHLRDGDFLVELKDDLNALIAVLEQRGLVAPAGPHESAGEAGPVNPAASGSVQEAK
jgi:hypothetical protein